MSRRRWFTILTLVVLVVAGFGLSSWAMQAFRGRPWRFEGEVDALAWSPDGTQLAIAEYVRHPVGDAMWVRLWRVADQHLLVSLPVNNHNVSSMAWTPDGELLAIAAYDTIYVYRTTTGTSVHRLVARGGVRNTNRVLQLGWTSDGTTLLAAAASGGLLAWDRATGAELPPLVRPDPTRVVASFATTADGVVVAAQVPGQPDGIEVWYPSDGRVVLHVEEGVAGIGRPQPNGAPGMLLGPDGRYLVGDSLTSILLWRLADGVELAELNGHEDLINSLAFSSTGEVLASGSGEIYRPTASPGDPTLRLWNVVDGTSRAVWSAHEDKITALAWRPDGAVVASGSLDRTVRFWTVE